ncbi:PREDICTED: homeobox protein E30-like [Papilio polytes]|uniref:homeobox protein E30-like n=1 Tax=Papilio polytes TaxID=76194 RepID=UPI00067656FF|nr:PREDICTED: homeobox protein E30-like [Papilio polytes]
MNEICHWQNKPFIEVLPHRQEHKNNGSNVRKKIQKNKRKRTTFTTEQLKVLEKTFASSKYLNSEHRRDLSKVLGLAEKCLKVWFQNKRMKEKREASESSDSSEQYSDSMSIESQIGSPELNTQMNYQKKIIKQMKD